MMQKSQSYGEAFEIDSVLYELLAQTRIWHYSWMKGHFIFCTLGRCRVLKYGCRPLSQLVMHKLIADRCWLSPLLYLSFSISSALRVHFAASPVSALPSWFSLWLIITDWLLVSPEGGHTVQLTSQAPGTQASPHISPLLHQRHDTWDPALQLKRWASSCLNP